VDYGLIHQVSHFTGTGRTLCSPVLFPVSGIGCFVVLLFLLFDFTFVI